MLSYINLKLPYSESKPFYPSNDNSDIPNKQETESFLSMKKQPLRTVFSRSLVMKMFHLLKGNYCHFFLKRKEICFFIFAFLHLIDSLYP